MNPEINDLFSNVRQRFPTKDSTHSPLIGKIGPLSCCKWPIIYLTQITPIKLACCQIKKKFGQRDITVENLT